MDMIFEIEAQKPEKLPTLYQFLKSEKSAKLKQKYVCTFIWLPGNYPALTFQTEDFRAVVYENNPIFDSLIAFAKKMTEDHTSFALVVNPDREGGFGITTCNEKGQWEAVGKMGYKFVFDVKKTPTKR